MIEEDNKKKPNNLQNVKDLSFDELANIDYLGHLSRSGEDVVTIPREFIAEDDLIRKRAKVFGEFMP